MGWQQPCNVGGSKAASRPANSRPELQQQTPTGKQKVAQLHQGIGHKQQMAFAGSVCAA